MPEVTYRVTVVVERLHPHSDGGVTPERILSDSVVAGSREEAGRLVRWFMTVATPATRRAIERALADAEVQRRIERALNGEG